MRHLCFYFLLFSLLLPLSAFAEAASQEPDEYAHYTEDWTPEQATAWREALRQLQAITDSDIPEEERCQPRWNIIWPLAKAGNLEARTTFYRALGLTYVRIPNYSWDRVTQNRFGVALFMHSRGAPRARATGVLTGRFTGKFDGLDPRIFQLSYSGFSVITEDEPVMTCMLQGERQACARLAVERKLIPSFEDLAKEIDALTQNGKTFSCPTAKNWWEK